MTKEEALNILITGCDTNKISDGYHTFGELYEHRIILFLVLCKYLKKEGHHIWKSRFHSDGTHIQGWFIMGIGSLPLGQITYHLPIDKWDIADAEDLDVAPKWDGHNSNDALHRLSFLLS